MYDIPDVVGVCGKKRHGKDTIADALVSDLEYRKLSLADPLKEMLLELNPIIGLGRNKNGAWAYGDPIVEVYLKDVVEALGWEATKDKYPESRRLLQVLGTDIIRAMDPDYWIDLLVDKMTRTWTGFEENDNGVDRWPMFVVPDVRYPNEAERIQGMGGMVIKVLRPGMADDDKHVSETSIDLIVPDFTLVNDKTPEDLKKRAVELLIEGAW